MNSGLERKDTYNELVIQRTNPPTFREPKRQALQITNGFATSNLMAESFTALERYQEATMREQSKESIL